jgi:hypothetical protein
VVEEQYADGLPADSRNQSPLDGFFHYQPHWPTGAAFWRITADHRNDALFLAIIQHFGRSWPLLLVEGAFEAAFLVTVTDLANGLWSQGNYGGNLWCADALGQLRQRHGAEYDSHLLHTTAQQLSQFFPVLGCDLNTQGWTGHALSMRQNIFEWNCFIRKSLSGQRPR